MGKPPVFIYTQQKMRVRARRACFLLHKDKITQMSPIDGPIVLVSEIYLAHTSDVNISEAQPSKASGLGGVRSLRSKSAPTLPI